MKSRNKPMMTVQKTALCLALLVGFTAHGQTMPNQVGTRYFGAADTDGNTMSRISIDGWVHNRTPQTDTDSTLWDSFYDSADMTSYVVGQHTIPVVSTADDKTKAGAFFKLNTPVDITDATLTFRVRSNDWANVKTFSLILASDGIKFEHTVTVDMTALVVNKIDDSWIEISVPTTKLESYQHPDLTQINAVMWKVTDSGESRVSTEVDNFKIVRDSVTVADSTVTRPLMIRERDRRDWGISVNKTNYTTDSGHAYTGQGLTGLANYHNGAFSLVGELGIGQLNNVQNKNFLLGDMTATYKASKNLSFSAGVYGDAIASERGLAEGATFQGVSAGAEVGVEGVGGIAGALYQQNYSNNNIQQGFVAKIYAETPVTGVNVYVSTKQYTNSLPYNGLFYSPADYARYNIGVGYRVAVSEEWTLSGHVDMGRAVADKEWSNVSSYRVALDKTLVKNMTAGVAIGSDINPSNNYRYNYVMANFRYTF